MVIKIIDKLDKNIIYPEATFPLLFPCSYYYFMHYLLCFKGQSPLMVHNHTFQTSTSKKPIWCRWTIATCALFPQDRARLLKDKRSYKEYKASNIRNVEISFLELNASRQMPIVLLLVIGALVLHS